MDFLNKIFEFIATTKAAIKAHKARKQASPKVIARVAVCVGHSRKGDQGAVSVGGVSEWAFNKSVAGILKDQLKQRGIYAIVIDDYPAATYSGAMRAVSKEIDKHNVDIAIELHFNSFSSSSAEGFEYLHYESSAKGKKLAICLEKAHEEAVQPQKNRGIKAIGSKGRGGGFLRSVRPPAVICEPFFGSNPKEWVLLGQKPSVVAGIYANGIAKYFDV
jgi:N-acetylmuramoyl-L-alanine amidase